MHVVKPTRHGSSYNCWRAIYICLLATPALPLITLQLEYYPACLAHSALQTTALEEDGRHLTPVAQKVVYDSLMYVIRNSLQPIRWVCSSSCRVMCCGPFIRHEQGVARLWGVETFGKFDNSTVAVVGGGNIWQQYEP